jgi:DNA anti-recombination protein RmuC
MLTMSIFYIVIALLSGFVIAFVFLSLFSSKNKIDNDLIAQQLNKLFPDLLQKANQQLVLMADQKLGAEKKEIKNDLTNKKSAIEDMVKRILQELDKNQQKLEKAEMNRIGSFKELKTSLSEYKKVTSQLSATTDGLKKLLSNNQLRGAFG